MPEMPELLRSEEYRALRATIRERGTVRLIVTVLTFSTWAIAILAACALFVVPFFSLIPLTVLAAGFEVIFALHVGVERIGRYVHAQHETVSGNQARWEGTAVAFSAPTGGTSPLAPALFIFAAMVNLALGTTNSLDADASVLAQNPLELAPLAALHVGFVLRVVLAHRFAATQRVRDGAEFERLLRGDRPKN